MARTVVVTTARVTTNAARSTVAGATRTTATMVTTATMTPNGDKDNDMASAAVNNTGKLCAGARVPGNATGS